MSDDRRPPVNREAPQVLLESRIQAAAGRTVQVPTQVIHRGRAPARLRVTVVGLDTQWAPAPMDLGVLQPGEAVEVLLTLLPERGALGADYPFTIAAEATNVHGGKAPVIGVAQSTLAVDSAERITMTIDPQAPSAVFGRKFRVDITNSGEDDRDFHLRASSASGASVHLQRQDVTAPAGRTVSIRGKVRIRRPVIFGGENSYAFSVAAQGAGAPEFGEGSVLSKPMIRRGAAIVIGLILVVALWAGLAIVFIPKISDAFKPDLTAGHDTRTTEQSPSPGQVDDGSGSSSGGSESGETTDGTPGRPGQSGPGDGGNGNGGDEQTPGYQLTGTVTGPGAIGTTATLSPTSLSHANEIDAAPANGASKATLAAFRSMTDGAIGKVPSGSLDLETGALRPRATEVTDDSGAFTFSHVAAPGYYLLTLSNAGYQTQRFIINSDDLASPKPLKVALQPGTGSISGLITDAAGTSVGAATVTVANDDFTLQTASVSQGSHGARPGSWAVDGLSTPASYLVTVTAPGYGATSVLVDLDASGSDSANITLHSGQASITGIVTGENELGESGGLGGITVSATNGTLTRSVTTVTRQSARGRFILPNMPSPGTYTVTISGDGFLTQTRTVTLNEDAGVAAIHPSLTRADSVVQGTVTGTDETGTDEGGLVGIGLTLTSSDVTLKTMTTSGDKPGSYRFTGVPPGTYVLTASQYGRVPSSATVTLTASKAATENLVLARSSELELPATSRIRVPVVDARTGGPLTCDRTPVPTAADDCIATVSLTTTVDRDDPHSAAATVTAEARAKQNLQIVVPDPDDENTAGLTPGLYAVTVSAPGYEAVTTHVQVAQDTTALAPQVSMPPLGVISGTISTRAGKPDNPTCVVAIPAGTTLPTDLPTSCSLHSDGVTCSVPSLGDALPCAMTSLGGDDDGPLGTYQVRGLAHGKYRVLLVPQDPEYTYAEGAPPEVTVELGGDAQFNAVLDRYGRIQVLVLTADENASLTPADDATVTVDPTPAISGQDLHTDDDGLAMVTGATGTFTVTADGPEGTNTEKNVIVSQNQTTQVTLVLTQPLGPVVGRVVADVDGHKTPVSDAAVTLSGVVGYAGQTQIPGTVQVATDSNGCYAVVPQGGTSLPLTSDECATAVDDAAVGTAGFVTKQLKVTVNASGSNAESLTAPADIVAEPGDDSAVGSVPTIVLDASPVPFGTHKLIGEWADGSTTDLSMDPIAPSAKPAAAGTVSIKADNGTLSFTDNSIPGGKASPGSYTFTASAPGFAPDTGTLACPPGFDLSGEACSLNGMDDGDLTLKQLPEITGTITVPAGASGSDTPAVDWKNGPSGTSGAEVALTSLGQDGDGNDTFTVAYSDPQYDAVTDAPDNLATPGKYVFSVTLPGYTQKDVTVWCGKNYTAIPTGGSSTMVSNGCTALSTTLAALPTLSGTVELAQTLSGSPDTIAGATATPDVSNVKASVRASDSDDTTGTVIWKDPNQPEGVVDQGTYHLTVSKPGYRDSDRYTIVVDSDLKCTVTDGNDDTVGDADADDCDLGTITLQMFPAGGGTVTADYLPPSGSIDWGEAKVDVAPRPTAASKLQVHLEADNDCGESDCSKTGRLIWEDPALPDTLTGITQPGKYALTITVPGYEPISVPDSGTFPCTIGDATCGPTDVDLTRYPKFSGKIKAEPALSDYSGAHVTVTNPPKGVGDVRVSVDKDGKLTWQDPDQPDGLIVSGTYTLTATMPGYLSQTTTVTCSDPGPGSTSAPTCTAQDISLKATTQLRVEVQDGDDNPVKGARMTFQGNTVTLDEGASGHTFPQSLNPDSDDYSVAVRAAGYEFDPVVDTDSGNVTCASGETGLHLAAGGVTTCTVTLTKMGAIEAQTNSATPNGTDSNGDDNPPIVDELGSVDITATFDGTSFPARSTSSGTATITGSLDKEGLAAGTWAITATRAGYKITTGTVTIGDDYSIKSADTDNSSTGSMALSCDPDTDTDCDDPQVIIDLQPNPISLQAHLNGSDSKDFLPEGTVTVIGNGITATCTIPDAAGMPSADGCVTHNNDDKYVVFDGLYPGRYTLKVNPTDASVTQVQVTVQINPATKESEKTQAVVVSLSSMASTLTGTVKDGSGELVGDDVTIYLSKDKDDPEAAAGWNRFTLSTHPDSSGTFSIPGIPQGTYYLVIEASGYQQYVSSSAMTFSSTSNPNTTLGDPIDLSAGCGGTSCRSTSTLNLTVNSQATGADFSGATVKLKQTATPDGVAPVNTEDTWSADTPTGDDHNVFGFTDVPSGTYTVTVTDQTGAPFPSTLADAVSISDDDGGDTVDKDVTLTQANVTLPVEWSTGGTCTSSSPTAVSLTLSNGTESADSITADIDEDDPKAQAVVYLPPGSYTWSVDSTSSALGAWTAPDGNSTFTIAASDTTKTPTAITLTATQALLMVKAKLDTDDSAVTGFTATVNSTSKTDDNSDGEVTFCLDVDSTRTVNVTYTDSDGHAWSGSKDSDAVKSDGSTSVEVTLTKEDDSGDGTGSGDDTGSGSQSSAGSDNGSGSGGSGDDTSSGNNDDNPSGTDTDSGTEGGDSVSGDTDTGSESGDSSAD